MSGSILRWPRFTAFFAMMIMILAARPAALQGQDAAEKPSKTEDVAALLPAGTLFHLEFDGGAAARTADQLAIARILQEPQVKKFLQSVLRWLRTGVMGVEAQLEFMIDGSIEQVHQILEGRLTVSFLGLTQVVQKQEDMEWSRTVPQLLMTWRLGEQVGAAEKLLESGQKLLAQEMDMRPEACEIAGAAGRKLRLGDAMEVMYLVKNGLFVAGTEMETLSAFVKSMDQGAPAASSLKASKNYQTSCGRLRRPNSIIQAFVSIEGLIEKYAEELPEDVGMLLQLSGVGDVNSIGMSLEFDGAGVRERIFAGMRPKSRLRNVYAPQSRVRAHEILPAETGLMYTFSLNWDGLYNYLMDIVKALEPYAHEQIVAGIDEAGQMIGQDLQKDVLTKLGHEVCVAAFWPDHGLIPDLALMLSLKDKPGMTNLGTGLMERFQGQINSGTVSYMGHDIHWFGPARMGRIPDVGFRPQIRISWTIVDDYLVITPWPQAAKNLIRGIKSGRQRLKDKPDFKKVLARLRKDVPSTGSGFLAYVDVKGLAGFVLDNGVPFVQSLIPDPQTMGAPVEINWALWPETDVITRHLEGIMAAGSMEDAGFYAEYYTPTGILVPQVLGSLAFLGLASGQAVEMSPPGVVVEPAEPETSRPVKKK